jgi:hypothetical protein
MHCSLACLIADLAGHERSDDSVGSFCGEECLNGTIGESESSSPKVASPQTELQKGYRRVRSALEQLLEHVGLRAA